MPWMTRAPANQLSKSTSSSKTSTRGFCYQFQRFQAKGSSWQRWSLDEVIAKWKTEGCWWSYVMSCNYYLCLSKELMMVHSNLLWISWKDLLYMMVPRCIEKRTKELLSTRWKVSNYQDALRDQQNPDLQVIKQEVVSKHHGFLLLLKDEECPVSYWNNS